MGKEAFLIDFFKSLKTHGVDYYVFGEYSNLPKDTNGSDVDIYVGDIDLREIDKIIACVTRSHQVVIGSYWDASISHHYRLLTESWGVQIDVLSKGFKYRGADYYPSELLKAHVIEYNGINVLEYKYGCVLGFYKDVVFNGKSKDKYIRGIINVINSNPSYYKDEIIKLYGLKVQQIIFNNLTIENLSASCSLLQHLMQRRLKKGNYLLYIIEQFKRFKRLFHKRPGYVIAVEGTDGAGKSTIINKITPILNEGFHNSIIYMHLRPHVLPDLGVFLGKRKASDANTICETPHEGKESCYVVSVCRWLYYFIDYTFGYLKCVWLKIHIRSYIFIFDRYYYDYYIDPKRLRVKLPKWVIKIGDFFVPSPDLILCLGGNPNEIYKRKPETSIGEVRRQNERLKHFSESKRNTIWIDTTCEESKAINAAMKAILHTMKKRFTNIQTE